MEPILDVTKIMYNNLKDNYDIKIERDGESYCLPLKRIIVIFELIMSELKDSKYATNESHKDMLNFINDYESYKKNTESEEWNFLDQIEIYIKHFKDYKILNKYCNMLKSETIQSTFEPGKFILSDKLIKSVYFNPNGQIQIET